MSFKLIILSFCIVGFHENLVLAQKGMGSSSGIARENVKPLLQTTKGTVLEINTGPCEKTTGRALMGTHLILETEKRKSVNMHLGPNSAQAVVDLLAHVKVGSKVEVEAFETAALPMGHQIAKVLRVDGQDFVLRDESFRPLWAGSFRAEMKKSGGRGPCF